MNRRKWLFSAFGGFMAALGLRKAAPVLPEVDISTDGDPIEGWYSIGVPPPFPFYGRRDASRLGYPAPVTFSGKWSPE